MAGINPMLLSMVLVMGTRNRERRRRLMRTVPLISMPLAPAAHAVVGAFAVDQETRRAEREIDQLTREAVNTITATINAQPAAGRVRLPVAQLDAQPNFARAVDRLNLRGTIT